MTWYLERGFCSLTHALMKPDNYWVSEHEEHVTCVARVAIRPVPHADGAPYRYEEEQVNEMVCHPTLVEGRWVGCGGCAQCAQVGVRMWRIRLELVPVPKGVLSMPVPLSMAERKTIDE